jgi:hypothetical protein
LAYGGRDIVSIIKTSNINCKEYDFIVDNGAFSVWKSGKSGIDLDGYLDMCHSVKNNCDFKNLHFIALDQIPGKFGVKPSQLEVIESGKFTITNYEKMNDLFGKQALPVFHQHEDFKHLKHYMKFTDFICISPANDETNIGREKWLDEVFTLLDVRASGIKTHGLAVTSEYLCSKYPFYSVDSISWKAATIYGRLNLWEQFTTKTIGKADVFDKVSYADYLGSLYYSSKVEDGKKGLLQSLKFYTMLEKYLTDLWSERGIKWD